MKKPAINELGEGLEIKKKSWIKRHWKKLLIILGSAIAVAGIVFAVWFFMFRGDGETETCADGFKMNEDGECVEIEEEKPEPVRYYSRLTGKEVENEAALNQPVTAVMIENSTAARPQSGLKQAGIVYEAIAEGGITRFAAIYQEAKPQLIGPVRSLRMHYLEWMAPYQAAITHVGGAEDALIAVKNYRDADQSYNSGYFWRSKDRYSPHNVYTSFENLDRLNADKGWGESKFTGWERKADEKWACEQDPAVEAEKCLTNPVRNIDLDISSYTYNVSYVWDETTNTYVRYLAGSPHVDREEGQLMPNVVVALMADQAPRPGSNYYNMVTTGQGKAYIFQDGKVIQGSWFKANRDSELVLYDEEGEGVKLNVGQVWVSAVPNGKSVSWN